MSLRSLRPILQATRIAGHAPSAAPSRAASFAALRNLIPVSLRPKKAPKATADDTPALGTSLYDRIVRDKIAPVATRASRVSSWHKSSTANFKTSKRKLNDLSRLIAGRGVDEGVLQLKVSPKKQSSRLLSMLALARDHAIAKGLNRDKLVIAQSWTTQGPSIKRVDIKGRGRRGIKHHPSSKLHVLLAEGVTHEEKRRQHKRDGWRMSCRGLSEGDGVGIGRSKPIINIGVNNWKW